MNKLLHIILMLIIILFLLAPQFVTLAEGDSPWDGVINEDGEVIANDHGLVKMEAEWMPSLPIFGDVNAEYHVYQADDGTTMLQPNAMTLFFMALNPSESGLDQMGTDSIQTGLSHYIQMPGYTQNEIIGLSTKEIISNILSAVGGLEGTFTDELADAVLAGEDAWSFISFKDVKNIFKKLYDNSLGDTNIYTAMFLFDDCAASPIGCLPGMVELEEEEPVTVETPLPTLPQCRAPQVVPGDILPSSTKMAPNYVLVTGQDDTKRGVDLCFFLDVLPTLYHIWQLEVVGYEDSCNIDIGPWWQNRINRGDATLSEACPPEHYSNQPVTQCVEYVYSLPEAILFASGKATLSQNSRSWILDELSIFYPGAHLIQPDWSFLNHPSLGSSHWEVCEEEIQVRDPGIYDLQVCFETSGTAVSDPRSGCWTTGDFKAYLIQTTIIW